MATARTSFKDVGNICEGFQQNLICTFCKNFLTVGPVYCGVIIGNVCGRCVDKVEFFVSKGVLQRSIAFELLLQSLQLPCRYAPMCKILLKWGEVSQHEVVCKKRMPISANKTIEQQNQKASTDLVTIYEMLENSDAQLLKVIVENVRDLKILECPGCHNFMDDRIYNCTEGHSFCGQCKSSRRGCPTCRVPLKITDGRNYALQRLSEIVKPSYRKEQSDRSVEVNNPNLIARNQDSAKTKCPLEICNHWISFEDTKIHFEEIHKQFLFTSNLPFEVPVDGKFPFWKYTVSGDDIFILKTQFYVDRIGFDCFQVNRRSDQPNDYKFQLQFIARGTVLKYQFEHHCGNEAAQPEKDPLTLPRIILEEFIFYTPEATLQLKCLVFKSIL